MPVLARLLIHRLLRLVPGSPMRQGIIEHQEMDLFMKYLFSFGLSQCLAENLDMT